MVECVATLGDFLLQGLSILVESLTLYRLVVPDNRIQPIFISVTFLGVSPRAIWDDLPLFIQPHACQALTSHIPCTEGPLHIYSLESHQWKSLILGSEIYHLPVLDIHNA